MCRTCEKFRWNKTCEKCGIRFLLPTSNWGLKLCRGCRRDKPSSSYGIRVLQLTGRYPIEGSQEGTGAHRLTPPDAGGLRKNLSPEQLNAIGEV